ncbi:MAG: hypothetical protein QM500_13985 [Methylococcales bacterium]
MNSIVNEFNKAVGKMTTQDIMDLELNAKVNYEGFKNLLFKGKDERHVILQDSHGDTKKVYIELFAKYGKAT